MPAWPAPIPLVQVLPVSVFVETCFGFKRSSLVGIVAVQVALVILYRLVALAALKKLNFQQR